MSIEVTRRVVAAALATFLFACSGTYGGNRSSTAEAPTPASKPTGRVSALPSTSRASNPLAPEVRGRGWYCYRAESGTASNANYVAPCERTEPECLRRNREHATRLTVTMCRFQPQAACVRGRHIETQNEIIACFQTDQNCSRAHDFMLYGPNDDPENREYEFVTDCHTIE